MLKHFTNRLRSAFSVVIFGMRILRWCGPKLFFSKMMHQLYGRTIFIVREHRLDIPKPFSSFQCDMKLASAADVDELFRALPDQSRDGRYQLLVRRWYHERGFGDCYIARTANKNEICHVRWLVTPHHIRQMGWEDRFTLLDDQVMMENSYTLEKYRRQGVNTATNILIGEIAINLGFTNLKAYTYESNSPQMLANQKEGGVVYSRVFERHFLFHVTRKTLEEYDPPIPIAELINVVNETGHPDG